MEQTVFNQRKQLSNLLFLSGVIGVIFGGIHLSSFFTSGSNTSVSDAGFNAGLGILELVSGWLILKGKLLAIPVAIVIILASLIYSYAMGRGFNFFMLVIGGVAITWMVILWKRGGLA